MVLKLSRKRDRRQLVGVAAFGAVVVGLASVAFACTTFRGQLTMAGNQVGGNTGTVTVVGGEGIGNTMSLCPSFNNGEPKGVASVSAAGGLVSIAVQGYSMCTGVINGTSTSITDSRTALPAGTYHINLWTKGAAWTSTVSGGSTQWGITKDCMDDNHGNPPPEATRVGSVVLDTNGVGQTTVAMTGTADALGNAQGVCVDDGGGTLGIHGPIVLV